jgi:flagellar secretion chaperone FliS
MTYAKQAAAYQNSRVSGSSREQLVVLLYEQLLANLRRAALQIQRHDIEGKAESLQRSSDIVFELLSSLDSKAGGELAQRLNALYTWFIAEIGAVGRTLDTTRLDRLIAIIADLHVSWAAAARQLATERQK